MLGILGELIPQDVKSSCCLQEVICKQPKGVSLDTKSPWLKQGALTDGECSVQLTSLN